MEIGLATGFIIITLLVLKKRRRNAGIISVIYILAIIYLTFISRELMPIHHYSINPFGAARRGLEFGGGLISGLLHGTVKITNWAELRNIILNILLFIPFGYLLPTLFPRLRSWHVILLGLAFSLCIELLQLLTRLGYADVDDLINNTFGAAIGFLCYKLVLKDKAPFCQTTNEE